MDGQSPEFPTRPPERKERGPQGSNNSRVESVYRRHPEMANREYTLPCITRPIYQDQSVLDNPELAQTIAEHTRVIVTPVAYEKLSDEQRTQSRVLASPYECGRVLEADERVKIGDDSLVLTIKGVGATEFARTTGADNPWMMPEHKAFNEDEALKLSAFPFIPDLGGLTVSGALNAVDQIQELQELGLDTEKILAVHEILEMSDEHGIVRPIKYFQDLGLLPQNESMAIAFRASKSNYRLLEPVLMDKLNKKESISDFWDHTLEEYGQVKGVANPKVKDYLYWLSEKVISQNLSAVLQGYEQAPGHWQDLGRNITTMGERMDIASVKTQEDIFIDPSIYSKFVLRNFGYIDSSLKALTDTAYTHLDGQLDLTKYGDHLETIIDRVLEEVDYKALQEKFDVPYRNSTDFDNSEYVARKAISRHFTGGRYVIGRNRDQWRVYEDYMSKKFASK